MSLSWLMIENYNKETDMEFVLLPMIWDGIVAASSFLGDNMAFLLISVSGVGGAVMLWRDARQYLQETEED